jgi:branched-chain amino acid transport system permease protein
MEHIVSGLISLGIQVILAISVNIISGYARQLSLGQAAFAGLGAYASALFNLDLGYSFWIACPLSLLLTGGVGFLLGLPCLRGAKNYVLVMTLGMNFLLQHLLLGRHFMGGYFGLGRIPPPQLFETTLQSSAYLPLIVVAIGMCLMIDRWFWHSRFGQALRSRLDQRTTTYYYGTTEAHAVLMALVISTAMAGLAGSLFAHFEAFISPFDFNLEMSLFILGSAACGGLGSLVGVMLGAVLLGGIVEIVQPLSAYRLLISGVVFLFVGLWFPRGILTFFKVRGGTLHPATRVQPSDRSLLVD